MGAGVSDFDLLHGGALSAMMAAFPKAPQPWLDLSTGINPWPYPHHDLKISAFHRLPEEEDSAAARLAMARAFACNAESIALTPGSQAAIEALPQLAPSERVSILAPTYAEHAKAWREAGATVHEASSLTDLAQSDIGVVVNPNNPTGALYAPSELLELARSFAARGGTLIVDEAFADLTPDYSLTPYAGAEGLILLRSFGKFYGLAGVRLGAIIGTGALAQKTRALFGPWSISGPALALARRAYADMDWSAAMRARLIDQAAKLDATINTAGFHIDGGALLFRWVRAPDAHALWRRLAQRGVYVRRFAWSSTHLRFGLPESDAALERLREALDG